MDKTARFRIFLVLMVMLVAAVTFYEHRDDLRNLYHRKISDPGTIREYLERHPVRKLQLGADQNVAAGWLNSDINVDMTNTRVYIDATADYPLPTGSFHYILAEHLIEHLPWEGGLKMLKESYRVLAPGGKIRIITPNLEKSIYALNHDSDPEVKRVIQANLRLFGWPDTPIAAAYVFNKGVREWGHEFIYDPKTLRKTFEMAGFKDVREVRIGEKTDPVFAEAEFRTRELGEDLWLQNSWGAMVFEATK